MDAIEIQLRVNAINRTTVGERESGHAFSGRYAAVAQHVCVLARDVRSGRVGFQLVVEIDDAGVERNDVADLVDENRDCIFYVER